MRMNLPASRLPCSSSVSPTGQQAHRDTDLASCSQLRPQDRRSCGLKGGQCLCIRRVAGSWEAGRGTRVPGLSPGPCYLCNKTCHCTSGRSDQGQGTWILARSLLFLFCHQGGLGGEGGSRGPALSQRRLALCTGPTDPAFTPGGPWLVRRQKQPPNPKPVRWHPTSKETNQHRVFASPSFPLRRGCQGAPRDLVP